MAEYKIVVDFKGGKSGNGYKSKEKEKEKRKREKAPIEQLTFGERLENTAFEMIENGTNAFGDLMSVAGLVAIGRAVFSHEVQKIGRYAGSQQAQDVANATLSAVGMIFNPIGTAYEIDERAYQKHWESIGLTLARERAGTAINRSRTDG